ncbi:GNAT family N-acetyltransferase [Dactylosporangium sp. NPDC006015]|uniref:GNAT family N-acetyltransferase n=1 Tax=unclassified Dactylosporangium TaxID=2621675 RepID=UPI0033A4CB2E
MRHPTMRLRQPDDLDTCIEMLRAVHETDGYPLRWPADPRRWLNPPHLLQAWLAEDPTGAIVGHVAVRYLHDGGGDVAAHTGRADLSRLYVAPGARRRGVAGALVACVVSWAARHGHVLTLDVTEERRSAATAFYEATGWRHLTTTDADWVADDGSPVRLRRYVLDPAPRTRM